MHRAPAASQYMVGGHSHWATHISMQIGSGSVDTHTRGKLASEVAAMQHAIGNDEGTRGAMEEHTMR
jgi:hypothetical protein